jgi:hypothetical protein
MNAVVSPESPKVSSAYNRKPLHILGGLDGMLEGGRPNLVHKVTNGRIRPGPGTKRTGGDSEPYAYLSLRSESPPTFPPTLN